MNIQRITVLLFGFILFLSSAFSQNETGTTCKKEFEYRNLCNQAQPNPVDCLNYGKCLNTDLEKVEAFKKGCDLDSADYNDKEKSAAIYQNCELEGSIIMSLFRVDYEVSINNIANPLSEATAAYEKACKADIAANYKLGYCSRWFKMLNKSLRGNLLDNFAESYKKYYGPCVEGYGFACDKSFKEQYENQWDIIKSLINTNTKVIKYLLFIDQDSSADLPNIEELPEYFGYSTEINIYLQPEMKELPWIFAGMGSASLYFDLFRSYYLPCREQRDGCWFSLENNKPCRYTSCEHDKSAMRQGYTYGCEPCWKIKPQYDGVWNRIQYFLNRSHAKLAALCRAKKNNACKLKKELDTRPYLFMRSIPQSGPPDK